MENEQKLVVIKPFRDMWLSNKELEEKYKRHIYQFINVSGRVAGKTINFIQLMFYYAFQYPTHDIIVMRANSSQLKQSVFIEFKKLCFNKLPLKIFSQIIFRSSPPLSITFTAGNQILFGGVGMGSKSGANQSKGKATERKVSLIIVEETQEIFSGNSDGTELLNQSIATYIRFLDDEIGKIIYAGNRERNVNSKFNLWVKEKEKDDNFMIIESSYLDVIEYLNRATISMIMQEKELNPKNYEYMYLGIPVGGNDLVYGAFTQAVHVLPKTFEVDNSKIYQVYIGVDGSTTRDKTIFMPIIHFQNAKLVCKLGDMLYHNPRKNGQIRNNVMAQKHVKEWLRVLINKYQIFNKKITFVVDGHNTDLAENLEFELAPFGNVVITRFTKKDLIDTTEKVNNAFVEGLLYLTDESWKELLTNDDIHPFELYNELQTVCWREDDPTKFNDSIPNDMTDGIRYPIAYHSQNPYQIRDYSKGGS